MVTKIENTAAGPVTLQTDEQDKYAPANLILYRTSLALYRNLKDDGVFTEGEYRKIRTILNRKYGLSSDSIFAESA
jgi:hypothetical protein